MKKFFWTLISVVILSIGILLQAWSLNIHDNIFGIITEWIQFWIIFIPYSIGFALVLISIQLGVYKLTGFSIINFLTYVIDHIGVIDEDENGDV